MRADVAAFLSSRHSVEHALLLEHVAGNHSQGESCVFQPHPVVQVLAGGEGLDLLVQAVVQAANGVHARALRESGLRRRRRLHYDLQGLLVRLHLLDVDAEAESLGWVLAPIKRQELVPACVQGFRDGAVLHSSRGGGTARRAAPAHGLGRKGTTMRLIDYNNKQLATFGVNETDD